MKQDVFIDSRSPPKPSEPSLGRHCTCDESIAVAVAVAVKDHDDAHDNVDVDGMGSASFKRARRAASAGSCPGCW